jgi:hypothetical protein
MNYFCFDFLLILYIKGYYFYIKEQIFLKFELELERYG